MNKAYETMRNFWLDAKNLLHKKEVPALGERKICIAGVEMAATDDQGGIKNLMAAASSLGNASLYFENNSASGLGGFTGGATSGPVRDKTLRLMQAAAISSGKLDAVASLPEQKDPSRVTLFAVSADGSIFAKELAEVQARDPQNELYPFFAYTQQLIGAFREEQQPTAPVPPPSPAQEKKAE